MITGFPLKINKKSLLQDQKKRKINLLGLQLESFLKVADLKDLGSCFAIDLIDFLQTLKKEMRIMT